MNGREYPFSQANACSRHESSACAMPAGRGLTTRCHAMKIGVLSMFCSYFKTAISGNKRSVGMRESRLRPVRHMGEERWLITLEFAYALLGSPMGHWL